MQREATTLEDVHGKPASRRFQAQAQCGRRGPGGKVQGGKQEGEGVRAFSVQLQALQGRHLVDSGPQQHRTAGLRAQALFRSPQGVPGLGGAHDEHFLHGDAC